MTRHTTLIVIAALGLAASACRAAAPPAAVAAEPPPPLIEPELAQESRLVDPRADELMHQMSDRLARSTAFALEAEEVYDEVPEQSPRQQLTNLRHVALRRPDRLVGDAAGDALNRSFWYDGKTFSALDKEQYVWAGGAVPPTVVAAIGAAIGAIAGGGQGAAIGAAVGAGAGGVATAASSVDAAVIAAQSPQAFALAASLTVEIMTNVAVS